jgi:hypothetical protein
LQRQERDKYSHKERMFQRTAWRRHSRKCKRVDSSFKLAAIIRNSSWELSLGTHPKFRTSDCLVNLLECTLGRNFGVGRAVPNLESPPAVSSMPISIAIFIFTAFTLGSQRLRMTHTSELESEIPRRLASCRRFIRQRLYCFFDL